MKSKSAEISTKTPPVRTAQPFADAVAAEGEKLQSIAQEALKPVSKAMEALQMQSQRAVNRLAEAAALKPPVSGRPTAWLDTPRAKALPKRRLEFGALVQTTFDEYTLIGFLGEGGNGKVFSARNSENEQVAIKFLESQRSRTKLKRFKNEIVFCENDHGSNIVRVIDRGYAVFGKAGYSFCVMPLYRRSLRKLINEGLSPDQAIKIFVGILKGLKTAHERGVVHRDIKPENILFAEGSYEPVLCDFGIARFSPEEMATIVETKPGDRLANFQYAAPEQRKKGGAAYPQSDVYSAALILNEMFTREVPQADGYKTIGDVAPDYRYLDELFSSLYKQNPSERLYPVDTILSRMKDLADMAGRQAEVERLDRLETESLTPETFSIQIVDKRFHDGMLCFELSHSMPDQWFAILSAGNYSHVASLGHDTDRLRKLDKKTIALPLRNDESRETVTTIVREIDRWIDTATRLYNEAQISAAQEQHRQQEMRRKKQIETLCRENALNELLQNIQ